MADDPKSIEFPVIVTTNGVKVEVVLLLKAGTEVAVKSVKADAPGATVSATPAPGKPAPSRWPLAD